MPQSVWNLNPNRLQWGEKKKKKTEPELKM